MDPATTRTRYNKLKNDWQRTPAPARANLLKQLDKAAALMKSSKLMNKEKTA